MRHNWLNLVRAERKLESESGWVWFIDEQAPWRLIGEEERENTRKLVVQSAAKFELMNTSSKLLLEHTERRSQGESFDWPSLEMGRIVNEATAKESWSV